MTVREVLDNPEIHKDLRPEMVENCQLINALLLSAQQQAQSKAGAEQLLGNFATQAATPEAKAYKRNVKKIKAHWQILKMLPLPRWVRKKLDGALNSIAASLLFFMFDGLIAKILALIFDFLISLALSTRFIILHFLERREKTHPPPKTVFLKNYIQPNAPAIA